jgi:regulatory Fis family protein
MRSTTRFFRARFGANENTPKLPKLPQNGGKTPGSGRTQQLTVEQIKDALAKTINNVTRTAAMLGVSR